MRIDPDAGHAERAIEPDIRCLAADAGEGFERLARGWHFAVIVTDEALAEGHHVLRFRVIKADGLDVILEAALAELQHFLRCIGFFEQRRRRFVDAHIRRLCREHDGDEQREGVRRDKLRLRMRLTLRESGKDRIDLRPGEEFLSGHAVFEHDGGCFSTETAAVRALSSLNCHNFLAASVLFFAYE